MKSIVNKSHNKVVIGLSGGVDSAVSAYLLKKQGYEVSAVYLMCWKEPGCRAEDDRKDAMKTALELNIAFTVLDFRKEYKENVLEYFFDEYKKGRTPNPDILCNSVVKFGLFYDWAMENDFDFVATGHYAQTDGIALFSGKDLKKDQSYFLYRLRQEQLSHILFPIGDLLKSEVREIARKNNLFVANKKDSMGICFVGDINVNEFLREKFGVKKGEVKLSDGTVVGEHDGYFLFNVGHRGGWRRNNNIKTNKYNGDSLPKLYVVKIDKDKNEIIVGEKEECERSEFLVLDLNIIEDNFDNDIFIKIRNTGEFLKAKLKKIGEDKIRVKLFEKEFGVSSGQSCVFYRKFNGKYMVVGGGVIE